MHKTLFLLVLLVLGAACKTANKNNCPNNLQAKSGKSLNPTRLKFGVPVIHNYMCLESVTNKMESWGTPVDFQKNAKTGFHAGKGVFLISDAELDEKDIYRHRINDSTFEMLGILTEVRNGKASFPNIWYHTVDEHYLFAESKISNPTRLSNEIQHLNINQADSILATWGTSRK